MSQRNDEDLAALRIRDGYRKDTEIALQRERDFEAFCELIGIDLGMDGVVRGDPDEVVATHAEISSARRAGRAVSESSVNRLRRAAGVEGRAGDGRRTRAELVAMHNTAIEAGPKHSWQAIARGIRSVLGVDPSYAGMLRLESTPTKSPGSEGFNPANPSSPRDDRDRGCAGG